MKKVISPKVGDVVYKHSGARTVKKLYKGKIIGTTADGDLVAEADSGGKEIVGWQWTWDDYYGAYVYRFLSSDMPYLLSNPQIDKQFKDEERELTIFKLKYITKDQYIKALESLDVEMLNKLQAAIKP